MSISRRTVLFLLWERWGRAKEDRKQTFHRETCFFQKECVNSVLKIVNWSAELATQFGHQSILGGTLRVWRIQWCLREYVLWPNQWRLHNWANGACFHLQNRKRHPLLSEVRGNLLAGSNGICTGSLGFGKITLKVQRNYHKDNLSKSNFQHFPLLKA